MTHTLTMMDLIHQMLTVNGFIALVSFLVSFFTIFLTSRFTSRVRTQNAQSESDRPSGSGILTTGLLISVGIFLLPQAIAYTPLLTLPHQPEMVLFEMFWGGLFGVLILLGLILIRGGPVLYRDLRLLYQSFTHTDSLQDDPY